MVEKTRLWFVSVAALRDTHLQVCASDTCAGT